MRSAVVLLLAVTAVSCTSARMAGRDVVAVAKAPAKEWKKVAAGAAVIGAALLVDDEIARVARNNDSSAMDRVTDAIEPFGGGSSDKVMAGFLLYGVAAKNDRARAVAFDAIVSSVIASKAITPLLKELTGRERPNGGDADAFPSNHATQAFAVASVIAAHYDDRRWVKWAAYGLATGVGISRVYHGAHWTTDVLAGAAIGSLVGHTVAATNRSERARWTVTPIPDGLALCLSW
ncbi:MAG: phosphatase PAP2 family protein [Thermoanaerobaculia bacterium]